MTLLDKIQTDMIAAMKAKAQLKLDTLRSVKLALDRYRVDQRKPINEAAEQSILITLAKQRSEAAEAFRNAGRIESADKELAELQVIESYMLPEATETETDAAIAKAIAELTVPLSMKAMGTIINHVQTQLTGKRVNGKLLSDKVKARLI
jgi:uncharacterized protein YqeY